MSSWMAAVRVRARTPGCPRPTGCSSFAPRLVDQHSAAAFAVPRKRLMHLPNTEGQHRRPRPHIPPTGQNLGQHFNPLQLSRHPHRHQDHPNRTFQLGREVTFLLGSYRMTVQNLSYQASDVHCKQLTSTLPLYLRWNHDVFGQPPLYRGLGFDLDRLACGRVVPRSGRRAESSPICLDAAP